MASLLATSVAMVTATQAVAREENWIQGERERDSRVFLFFILPFTLIMLFSNNSFKFAIILKSYIVLC